MKRFEFLEHTADVIVKGYGDSLAEAFEATAEGMFAVITDLSKIERQREISLEVESIDREGLLVAFLSKLIYIHEVEQFIMKDCTVTFENENKLKAVIRGATFNEQKHEYGMNVKAVSYHMLNITEGSNNHPYCVQVLLDV